MTCFIGGDRRSTAFPFTDSIRPARIPFAKRGDRQGRIKRVKNQPRRQRGSFTTMHGRMVSIQEMEEHV